MSLTPGITNTNTKTLNTVIKEMTKKTSNTSTTYKMTKAGTYYQENLIIKYSDGKELRVKAETLVLGNGDEKPSMKRSVFADDY